MGDHELQTNLFRINVKNPYLEQMDFEEKLELHFSDDEQNSELKKSDPKMNLGYVDSKMESSTSMAYHEEKAAKVFTGKDIEENPYLDMDVESNMYGKEPKLN